MEGHVIDCCSLINLYTGWQGLDELAQLKGTTWYVCDAVMAETEYTREFSSDGFTRAPMDLARFIDRGLLRSARPENSAEMQDYVDFATEVDDGEAQTIAVARGRGYALLTDDYKASRLASELGLSIVSTPALLERWGRLSRANAARLRDIVRRISVLARFNPRADSPHRDWWRDRLS
jgi:hypothetical protein